MSPPAPPVINMGAPDDLPAEIVDLITEAEALDDAGVLLGDLILAYRGADGQGKAVFWSPKRRTAKHRAHLVKSFVAANDYAMARRAERLTHATGRTDHGES